MEEIKVEATIDFDIPVTPETILWLAVIERAMLDYMEPSTRLSIMYTRDLPWFFFEKTPQPYNLAYICKNFITYPDAEKRVHKRLRRMQELKEAGGAVIHRSRKYRGYF